MKTYQIINHGVQHEQYFHGCGVAHTPYDECYTGVGCDPREALDDALEQAALSGWNVDGIENTLSDSSELPPAPLDHNGEPIDDCDPIEAWHYVSLRLA